MKFDDVLMELDGFGMFQLRTVLLLVIPRVTLPFHFLLNNFIAAVPSHRCDLSPLDDGGVFRNLTLEQRVKVGIPVQDDGIPSSCQMFAEAQYHLLLNASNVTDLPTMDCLHGWMYDNSTFKSTLATQWDLVCDRKSMTKTTATIFFMGVMLGAVTFGWLSDRYGRRRMLLLSYLVAILFGCGSAFSSSFAMFAVMRFFTGLGLSGISIMSIVLCVEWTDNKHRTMVAILMSTDWSVSTAILPAVAYLVNDWRHLTVTVTMPLVLAVMTWRWVPESARWLISNGKVNEAHLYLSRCAEVNRRQKFMAELNPQVLSTVIIVENEDRVYSYLDLLRTPRLRRLTLLTATVWYGVASTYYGISLNVSGFGLNIYITQFIYGAIELPAKAFVCYTLNIIGRRANQAGSLLLTAICLFCNIFLPKGMWELQTAMSVLGKGCAEAAFTVTTLYTTELFPTVLRQNGLGFCSSIGRIGVSCAPLIILLEDVWLPLPNAVFCLIALIACLSASLLPETRNVHLPETIEDIEHRRENREKPILTAE